MITLDKIAETIWRDTYRHDTLLEWQDVKRNTKYWRRVMAAAETVRALILGLRAARKGDIRAENERLQAALLAIKIGNVSGHIDYEPVREYIDRILKE